MALLANQLMDSARLLSVMNGRADPLPHFLRVQNQGHMTQINTTQEDTRKNRKYPCPLCGKRFRFNSILSLHMRTHTGEKPFKCPYCDHRAAQKGNLKIHLRTHKQGNLGKGCGRVREENRLLHELEERAILRDRHVRCGLPQPPVVQLPQPQAASDTVQLPLAFTAPGPGGTASPSSTSGRMTATGRGDHTQAPPSAGFRCSFCKGKFRKKQELERHIRILHKPYKCTLCEFAASQEEELISHVETAHIASESPQSQRPTLVGGGRGVKPPNGEFPCEVCGQTFSQAWFLKGHMRKHKDSFEHCCQICSRRFKEPWFLKNHMKVHLNKLAAKTKQLRPNSNPADPDMSLGMAGVAPDSHHLYSQYVSSLHSPFLSGERAGHSEFQKILATADIGMKVKEMLGRMLAPRNNSLMEGENDHPLSGLNHPLPPLSSSSMEYHLQASANERDNLSSYLGWQVMAPGLTRGQVDLHTAEGQQWAYLAERRVSLDKQRASANDPEIKAVSRPGSPELSHVLNGSCTRPQTASTQDDNSIPSSPVLGEEKPYSDHISAQSASLTYHLKGYQHPQWNQDTRDIRNSSSSQTASPKAWSPATGLYSGPEDPGEGGGNQATLDMDRLAPSLPNPSSLHRAYGPPAGREDHVDPPGLHRSIQSFINGLTTSVLKGGRKRRAAGARVSSGRGEPGSAEGEERVGAGGSGRDGEGESVATHSTNRSQYEPLDLSRRPDWLVSSQAASAHNNRPLGEVTGLLQPHSPGSNGSPSSSTNRLQAPTGQHLAQSDWSELGSGTGGDLATPTELEDPRSYDSSAPDPDGALENPVSDSTEGHERPNKRRRRKHCSEEVAQRRADCLQGCPEETQEQWSRSVIRTLLSPAPLRRSRQTSRQQPPRDLLSVLQSSVRHNQMLLNGPAASFNGGGLKEGAEILGGKPFQCKYCPYSATQKGNLKTHVLCVHRRPFDSSLYPDRRLRRPHANPVLTQQGSTGSSYFPKSMGLEKAARSTHSGRDLIMTSTCGT